MNKTTKYKLLAMDVDGTLIRPDQIIPPETVDAVAEAQAAGVRIVLATGRSYCETIHIWRQLKLKPPLEPMVLIGGALVSEADTGRTLYRHPIDRALACEYSEALCAAGYSAACIVDAWQCPTDYILAESADAERIHRIWFGQMKVKTRSVKHLSEAADMPAPLRINAVVEGERGVELAEEMKRRFGDRLLIHYIKAPNYGVYIVEALAGGTNKWVGVQYVAQAYRIGPGHIVTVGDDVNDLPMIRAAGLGVAMPNSVPEVQQAAKHVASPSLGAFIREMTAGKYD